MEKDVGKIKKNAETDIVIRVDDFGGKTGITIREFTTSERYTGFTKSGTRIPLESFDEFKAMINSINTHELKSESTSSTHSEPKPISGDSEHSKYSNNKSKQMHFSEDDNTI